MNSQMLYVIILVFCQFLGIVAADAQNPGNAEIKKYSLSYLPVALEEYREFLTIPNNGRIREHRDANVQWCLDRFKSLGFTVQTLESDGIPHVLAVRTVAPEASTVLFYMQIDGQPVDSGAWEQESPYKPVLMKKSGARWEEVAWELAAHNFDPELRVFARSASDSKGPSMALISALQILKDREMAPVYNIKILMDFQEELSSPTLAPLVKGPTKIV